MKEYNEIHFEFIIKEKFREYYESDNYYIKIGILDYLIKNTCSYMSSYIKWQHNYYKLTKKQAKNTKKVLQLKRKIRQLALYKEYLIEEALYEQKYLLNPELYDIKKYRYKCSFSITPDNITKIKGYDKLEKYGWYSKTNPKGVVKDHRVSIKYGYDNNISPEIIGHLGNCEFLTYNENSIKSNKCSITLKELKKQIYN